MQGAKPISFEPLLDALRAALDSHTKIVTIASENGWLEVDAALRALADEVDRSKGSFPVVVMGGAAASDQGALTAAEEFAARSADMRSASLPGFGGIAIVYSVADVPASFVALVESLELNRMLHEHASMLDETAREQAALIDDLKASVSELRADNDEVNALRAIAEQLRGRVSDLTERLSVEHARAIDAEVRSAQAASAARSKGSGSTATPRAVPPGPAEPTTADIRRLLDTDSMPRLLGWSGTDEELSLPIPHDVAGVIDRGSTHRVTVEAGVDALALRETVCTIIDRAGTRVALRLVVDPDTSADVAESAAAIAQLLPAAELMTESSHEADLVLGAGDSLPWGWPLTTSVGDVAVGYVLAGVASEGSGGSHSIVQEARGIRELGASAFVCIPQASLGRAAELYGNGDRLFAAYSDETSLTESLSSATVAVATEFGTVPLLARVRRTLPRIGVAYYVQDYEPLFTDKRSRHSDRALLSYRLIPGQRLFAKTHWVRNVVAARHDVAVAKVPPSLSSIFAAGDARGGSGSELRVAAMIRPRTPRRRPAATYEALSMIERALGDNVITRTFGCSSVQAEPVARWAGSRAEHLGPLSSARVADLMRNSDVFIDGSAYQAFGRTGLEAMASGAVPLLPELGGAREYAVDGVNAVLIRDGAAAEYAAAVIHLARDASRLAVMREAGQEAAARFGVEPAARAQLALFASITSEGAA
jgi:hypothetical protein